MTLRKIWPAWEGSGIIAQVISKLDGPLAKKFPGGKKQRLSNRHEVRIHLSALGPMH